MQFHLDSGIFGASRFNEKGSKLAVVLPGANYSCRQPLLYFAIQALVQKGYQVVAIDKVYGEDPKWAGLTTMDAALEVVETDAKQLFGKISQQLGQPIHTVLGRSLGTYAMACALEHGSVEAKQLVWQTPSLNGKWPIIKTCGIRSFAIIGTADERFAAAKPHLPAASLIIDGADHGMEIKGDALRSIEVLKQVTAATFEWLE